jgi:hypothetical protein
MERIGVSIWRLILWMIFACLLASCAGLNTYDRAWYDDPEIEISPGFTEGAELNFQSYREGARGAKGSKGGGGCGCY